jgi:uncharacterized membrane protein YczE
MKWRLLKSVIGVTLASIGIACTLNCGLGAFSMTLAYKSLSLLIGVPLAIINIGCDFIMLLIAKRINKEKKIIGITTIITMTYGSVLINIFHEILPCNGWLCWFALLIPIGWAISGKARLGDNSSNILVRELMRKYNVKVDLARLVIDFIFLLIACVKLLDMVTWFTLFLTFGGCYILRIVYRIIGYKPKATEHDFII